MGQRMQLYLIKARSRLGLSIESGPWCASSICNTAISYQLAGFSDVQIVELSGPHELPLEQFLSDHPLGKNRT